MCKKLLPILTLITLVAATLVGCGQASLTPSTLTILSITEGNVLVMKMDTNSWTEAQAGMSLEAGDIIKTGDNSSAEITFFDGSTIELQAGTEIKIASLDISTDTGSTTITLEQTIGNTISRVIKLLDPASRYEVETPTGAAGVRGSVLTVQVIEDGTTWVTNQKGNIYTVAQGVEVQVPEGRQCVINPGQPPQLTETPAEINVIVEIGHGPSASVFIWDDTTDSWAIDEDTGNPVDGTNHETDATITVAGGHYYYVWLETANGIYHASYHPDDWPITSAPVGDAEAVYGYLAPDSYIHFAFVIQ
jgi:hypothetical protein